MTSAPLQRNKNGRSTIARAALATTALTYPLRYILERRGRLDVPNHRSSHTTPIPRGGGLAALVGAAAVAGLTRVAPRSARCVGIAALGIVGWIDDATGHVPQAVRLATQATTGALTFSTGTWDRIVGAVTTTGVVNVVNFMDGINGISSLTAITWGLNALTLEDESEDLGRIGALVAGSGLGFLPHNAPRARIFLGDAGSYALGAAMTAGILSCDTWPARYRAAAPLMLYGVDAAQAIVRRAAAGEPLMEPHREHIYQKLVDAGYPHIVVAALHAAGSAGIAHASTKSVRTAALGTTLYVGCYLGLGALVRPRRKDSSVRAGVR
ncbi:UDP-N-acetylmuramyl pentapeptide phosphotransferase/UDP-N-acetylglucosamine-1-phosphate transferase [Ornithinimicrobium humiphilum]|uniref:UDP-N-acetylmuramyl pentapeptide phosphotransferase/UDP-N-acetylglucosamine-1-phosphate transferase n=1 Tax=Ornithinimicrobium humiphilum TaxID=125288 RepID=A0A543K899_9MICO|nr:UDP-N-acetylmuramyl pentapeptide phosphotransferase/UDP-N-acetylglucosamine-1-phosphate transferase [Ornithinimicrobium humiphilum]